MNEILNKFLQARGKIMPEMDLKQPGLIIVLVVHLLKTKKEFMRAGDTDFIYRKDLDKACFQCNVAYGKSKDLTRRTQSDKFLRDKAFEILSNPKHDGCQRGLASMVDKYFDKKSSENGVATVPDN